MDNRWREQYERIKRWYTRLLESDAINDRRVDDFYSFFTCCFHLKDWLKNDPSVDQAIRDEAEAAVSSNRWLGLCADITNGSKHLRIDRRVRVDASSRVEKVEPAFQRNFVQQNAFQVGGIVVVAGGNVWDAQDVAGQCMRAWDEFLTIKGLESGEKEG